MKKKEFIISAAVATVVVGLYIINPYYLRLVGWFLYGYFVPRIIGGLIYHIILSIHRIYVKLRDS